MHANKKTKRVELRLVYCGTGAQVFAALTFLAKVVPGAKKSKLGAATVVEFPIFDEDGAIEIEGYGWARGYTVRCVGLETPIAEAADLAALFPGADGLVVILDAREDHLTHNRVVLREVTLAAAKRHLTLWQLQPIFHLERTKEPGALSSKKLRKAMSLPDEVDLVDVPKLDEQNVKDPENAGATGTELVVHALLMNQLEPRLEAGTLMFMPSV